eukprot:TRINITY_DN5242_c2_g2_i1.p1 TRINITY_DN5242_c2_g2~~TRINITY_DN5242_c2_g2_i1.p1  ORF type:complete len:782 (+),score=332.30 TRINITY_DN5242_c2_g2_i1:117-2348(+)
MAAADAWEKLTAAVGETRTEENDGSRHTLYRVEVRGESDAVLWSEWYRFSELYDACAQMRLVDPSLPSVPTKFCFDRMHPAVVATRLEGCSRFLAAAKAVKRVRKLAAFRRIIQYTPSERGSEVGTPGGSASARKPAATPVTPATPEEGGFSIKPDVLILPTAPQSGNGPATEIRVRSASSLGALYKVRCTDPDAYSVRPHFGLVPPGSEAQFFVAARGMDGLTPKEKLRAAAHRTRTRFAVVLRPLTPAELERVEAGRQRDSHKVSPSGSADVEDGETEAQAVRALWKEEPAAGPQVRLVLPCAVEEGSPGSPDPLAATVSSEASSRDGLAVSLSMSKARAPWQVPLPPSPATPDTQQRAACDDQPSGVARQIIEEPPQAEAETVEESAPPPAPVQEAAAEPAQELVPAAAPDRLQMLVRVSVAALCLFLLRQSVRAAGAARHVYRLLLAAVVGVAARRLLSRGDEGAEDDTPGAADDFPLPLPEPEPVDDAAEPEAAAEAVAADAPAEECAKSPAAKPAAAAAVDAKPAAAPGGRYSAIFSSMMKEFQHLVVDPGFEHIKKVHVKAIHQDVQLYRKRMPDRCPVPCYRAAATIKAPEDKIVSLLRKYYSDAAFAKKLTPEINALRVLERVDGQTSVHYEVDKLPWPLASRDLVYLVGEMKDESGATVVVQQSTHHPKAPAKGNSVRARVHIAGWRVEAVSGGACKVTQLGLIDPKGNIPSSVIDFFVDDMAHTFGRVQKEV